MFNKKKLITLTLPLSLLLAGCGDEGSSSTTNSSSTTTNGTVTVTSAISDMTATIRSEFNYTVPNNICADSEGYTTNTSLGLTNSNGLSVTGSNLNTISGALTTADEITTVTVTCRSTSGFAVDSFTITATDSNAPKLSISFPLTTGIYSADSIYMFGNVEEISGYPVSTVTITVDDSEYAATIAGTTWRSDTAITIANDSVIEIEAETTTGETSYKEITLEKDELYSAEINSIVKDIAVDESTGEVYVQLVGDYTTDIQIQQFNLDEKESEELSTTPFSTSTFSYTNTIPTSLTFDTKNERLIRSYPTGITYISGSFGWEFELSDSATTNGSDGSGVVPSTFITDVFYDPTTDLIYVTDTDNATLDTVDPTSGDRESYITSASLIYAVTVNSTDGNIYYEQGTDATGSAGIQQVDTAITLIHEPTAGAISDLTLNEADDEIFFVNGDGDLIKLDLTDNSVTTLVSTLFSVTSFTSSSSPAIGLHYDSVRNVLIAAGESTDGTNKLLVIDPISGEYAQIATGR